MLIHFSDPDRVQTPVQLFNHPEPIRPKSRIWPVFMPFSGCPYRCVYCAQEKQTGHNITTLDQIYQQLVVGLQEYFSIKKYNSIEIAFFGGTFTALDFEWQLRFLRLAADYKERGLISRIRCSTRPDCIDSESLDILKSEGLDMVELGIQSFSAQVLEQSKRLYSPDTALRACSMVKKSGLSLGIQLLPGLPGSVAGDLCKDTTLSCEIKPEAVRIYPCLVVKGTVLEKWYGRGEFQPWSVRRAVDETAFSVLQFWNNDIAVIRAGVALEKEFRNSIAAGPVHDAFGQMARSQALYLYLRTRIAMGLKLPSALMVPSRYNGEFWGHRRNLAQNYKKIGLTKSNVRFHSGKLFHLFF